MNYNHIQELLEQSYLSSHIIGKELLEYMYLECKASREAIAYILNTTPAKVYHDMCFHSIPSRKPGEKGTKYTGLSRLTQYKWGYGGHPLLTRRMRLVNSNGYVQLYMPEHSLADKNGYVYEHRLVAEDMLGRSLTPSEVVHHRDSNKENNSPENLEVMSASEHSSLGYDLMKKFKAPKSSDPRVEQEWLKIVGEVYSIFCKKNADYGPNNIAGLGVEGVVVRLFDKFMRLKNLTFNSTEQTVSDETIEDTVMDIIDYGVIYLLVKRGHWPEYTEPDFNEWEDLESFREMVKEKPVYDKDRFPAEDDPLLRKLKDELKKYLEERPTRELIWKQVKVESNLPGVYEEGKQFRPEDVE